MHFSTKNLSAERTCVHSVIKTLRMRCRLISAWMLIEWWCWVIECVIVAVILLTLFTFHATCSLFICWFIISTSFYQPLRAFPLFNVHWLSFYCSLYRTHPPTLSQCTHITNYTNNNTLLNRQQQHEVTRDAQSALLLAAPCVTQAGREWGR
jgi:hypothetical protein